MEAQIHTELTGSGCYLLPWTPQEAQSHAEVTGRRVHSLPWIPWEAQSSVPPVYTYRVSSSINNLMPDPQLSFDSDPQKFCVVVIPIL